MNEEEKRKIPPHIASACRMTVDHQDHPYHRDGRWRYPEYAQEAIALGLVEKRGIRCYLTSEGWRVGQRKEKEDAES